MALRDVCSGEVRAVRTLFARNQTSCHRVTQQRERQAEIGLFAGIWTQASLYLLGIILGIMAAPGAMGMYVEVEASSTSRTSDIIG